MMRKSHQSAAASKKKRNSGFSANCSAAPAVNEATSIKQNSQSLIQVRSGCLCSRREGKIPLLNIPIPPISIYMQRDCQQTKPLSARIKKIVGQVQGVGRMIEENRECPEILHTISSIHSALRSLEAMLLEDHVRHCVTDAATNLALLEKRLEEIIALYKRRLA